MNEGGAGGHRPPGCFASGTSVAQGDTIDFLVPAGQRFAVTVTDTVTGERMLSEAAPVAQAPPPGAQVTAAGRDLWSLPVPQDWPSSLYLATFSPGGDVWFAVRSSAPGTAADILVSVPFPTWQAYQSSGIPGQGLYLTEQPDRAVRVSFDRPGGGPAGFWEQRCYRWLAERGYLVDYCSGLDLHSGAADLSRYRLLVCAGHDEYWSAPMRDRVEHFTASGGNVAFLGANTCWWQARFEGGADGMRTMVCYRDAVRDPMTRVDPALTTVEWSSAPVGRPENAMTGVSFRLGAGCWQDDSVMADAAYTVRFADHWVFEGTGLAAGDAFAAGGVGYETDAAAFREVDGVPAATGQDGAPAGLVILATADLRHWRRCGQGGHATMTVFQRGRGTVFNAATVNWGNSLDDPVVARITGNVLDRLSLPADPARLDRIGGRGGVHALAAVEQRIFGVDDAWRLLSRPCCGQNLPWRGVGTAAGLVALAAPRESISGLPVQLYGLFGDGMLRSLPVPDADQSAGRDAPNWAPLCRAPDETLAVAISYTGLYTVTGSGALYRVPLDKAGDEPAWEQVGEVPGALAMSGMNGRLYATTADGRLVSWAPAPGWQGTVDIGPAPGAQALATTAGRIIVAAGDGLYWRAVAGPPAAAHEEQR